MVQLRAAPEVLEPIRVAEVAVIGTALAAQAVLA